MASNTRPRLSFWIVLLVVSVGTLVTAKVRMSHTDASGPATGSPSATGVQSVGTPTPSVSSTQSPIGAQPPQSQWVIDENRLPGTSAWRVPASAPTTIEGFADHVSAQRGDSVTLYVSTRARTFHIEAYRMGYYQGLGGRLVWRSGPQHGEEQRPAIRSASTNMITAPWSPSSRFRIGATWPPGVYMFKLVGSDGAQGYVPLTVRDDSSHAALVIQNSVTTWQAYNTWGGYSLYHGPDGSFDTRSRVVTFDRPYDARRGSAEFFWLEQPVVALAEKLGLDVTYWTDIDLHERPDLLLNHHALISLGHDEYWSSDMRRGALSARDHGVNIAFLGGNADYRHIRLDPSPLGKDRIEVDYKVASEDPLYGKNNAEVTSNWREGPVPRPESVLNGGLYQCNPIHADMVIVNASSWIFSGTGLSNGDRLPGAVELEYDRVDPRYPTPGSIQILAHSPVVCRGHPDFADLTYYSTSSGAGVVDIGSQGWISTIACGPPVQTPVCIPQAVKITANVLETFAKGPAGLAHPSKPNLARFSIKLEHPIRV